MTTLPAEVTPEVQELITELDASLERILGIEEKLEEERGVRNVLIGNLRVAGFSLRQIGLLVGFSHGQIKKISDAQGVVAVRGAVRA